MYSYCYVLFCVLFHYFVLCILLCVNVYCTVLLPSAVNPVAVNTYGTAVAQWLRCCVANRKVACSIPAGVSGFFIDIKSFRSHYGPGVNSASNSNGYQEYFLGVKAAGA